MDGTSTYTRERGKRREHASEKGRGKRRETQVGREGEGEESRTPVEEIDSLCVCGVDVHARLLHDDLYVGQPIGLHCV